MTTSCDGLASSRSMPLPTAWPSLAEEGGESAEAAPNDPCYRTLFEASDSGMCIVKMLLDDEDRPVDYRFLLINSAFEAQTGLRDALGKSMRAMRPDHEAHWFEIYGKVALTGVGRRTAVSCSGRGVAARSREARRRGARKSTSEPHTRRDLLLLVEEGTLRSSGLLAV